MCLVHLEFYIEMILLIYISEINADIRLNQEALTTPTTLKNIKISQKFLFGTKKGVTKIVLPRNLILRKKVFLRHVFLN